MARGHLRKLTIKGAINAWLAGASYDQITADFGISRTGLRWHLDKHKVPRRRSGGPRPKRRPKTKVLIPGTQEWMEKWIKDHPEDAAVYD